MIIGHAPRGKTTRVSSDSVWPLRRADGRTWAEGEPPADEQFAKNANCSDGRTWAEVKQEEEERVRDE